VISLNNEAVSWHEGMTVAELLKGIHDAHLFVVVRVNDHYVSKPNFDTYKIPDHAVIYLVPMIAGG
jgi:thiamine biosynthesis protein ThiS